MQPLDIDGIPCQAVALTLPAGSRLLVIRAPRGVLACGYVNPAVAEKFGEALATVTGVKNPDDMLAAAVSAATPAAAALGVRPGMTGRQALALFR